MRVVAGAARGRRLVVPAGRDVRPTSDRVKEALFSSLGERVAGARVLDLYAGSGALGLEALSRGATSVTAVEHDRRALDALRRNVDAVGLPGVVVVDAEVTRALARPAGGSAAGEDVAGHAATGGGAPLPGSPFDLVLADPPYRMDAVELARVLDALVAHLAPGAVVMVERAARDEPPRWPGLLLAGEPRRYGDTVLHRAVATTTAVDG